MGVAHLLEPAETSVNESRGEAVDEFLDNDEAEFERMEYEVTQSDFEMFGGYSDFIEGYAPRRSRRTSTYVSPHE